MSKSQQPARQHPAPRLYLVTPSIAEADAFSGTLRRALEATDIAAVLLRLAPAGERELINRIKRLAPIVQSSGAALVLDGHAELVTRAGADGSHLRGIEAFTGAIENLKPERIAGCGGLTTRHDAIVAAEGNADYLMFGDPGDAGQRPAFALVIERIKWCSELITTPCAGSAATLDQIAPLVAAGADFIAVGRAIWDDPRGLEIALADAASRLAASETVA